MSTQNADSAFASWLSCKFGLDETSRSIMVESPAARVEVHMLQAGEDPGQLLETTGLVVFECLQPSGVDDEYVPRTDPACLFLLTCVTVQLILVRRAGSAEGGRVGDRGLLGLPSLGPDSNVPEPQVIGKGAVAGARRGGRQAPAGRGVP